MIRVQTGSRLHFGLLSLPADEHWPDHDGQPSIPSRRFGGVGLMIQNPGVRVCVRPSSAWSAEGPLADRALTFAQRFADCASSLDRVPPRRIVVETAAPEHAGLGTGTQLGLAVARALAESYGLSTLGPGELAVRIGRGARSGLGVHGFSRGGFLVDGGKKGLEPIAPLVGQVAFPEDWPVVLIVPHDHQGLHGREECEAFECLLREGIPIALTESLCRLVMLGMLPALVSRDYAAFGEALYDFNARAGAAFATVQGGTYAVGRVAALVAFVQQLGVRGVGQSSWGPTVFAVVENAERADRVAQRVREEFALSSEEVFVVAACNHGTVIEDDAKPSGSD